MTLKEVEKYLTFYCPTGHKISPVKLGFEGVVVKGTFVVCLGCESVICVKCRPTFICDDCEKLSKLCTS